MRHSTRARTTVVVATVLTGLLGISPATADDLRWESEITYSANVDEGLLHLSSEILLTVLKPNARSGNTITRYYFDGIELTTSKTLQKRPKRSSTSSLTPKTSVRREFSSVLARCCSSC